MLKFLKRFGTFLGSKLPRQTFFTDKIPMVRKKPIKNSGFVFSLLRPKEHISKTVVNFKGIEINKKIGKIHFSTPNVFCNLSTFHIFALENDTRFC